MLPVARWCLTIDPPNDDLSMTLPRRIRARASLDDVRIHDLRHSFAKSLKLRGAAIDNLLRFQSESG